jgi:hypothetical protein
VAIATLSVVVLGFQNCAKTKFDAPSANSSSQVGGEGTGGPETPLNPGTNTTEGTVFQGGGGEVVVAPPTEFSSTSCTLGYPSNANPASGVAFNESDVLVAFSPMATLSPLPGRTLSVWYSDEHALTLGIRQINIKSAAGVTSTNYPVSSFSGSAGMILNPSVGATALTGDQAGTDTSSCPGVPYVCARPMFPALFITDITLSPGSQSGDWQFGGRAISPHAVFGTWKAATRTVDQTTGAISVATDADPAPNNTNLGGIPFPSGVATEGYTAVVSWEISRLGLQSGHTYRMQFMVHDGDQNKTGGDVGQNCVNVQMP